MKNKGRFLLLEILFKMLNDLNSVKQVIRSENYRIKEFEERFRYLILFTNKEFRLNEKKNQQMC